MKLARWNYLARISSKLCKLCFSARMWWYWQRYLLPVRNLIGWWRNYDSGQTACFLRCGRGEGRLGRDRVVERVDFQFHSFVDKHAATANVECAVTDDEYSLY